MGLTSGRNDDAPRHGFSQPDPSVMKKAYARWAPVYDLTYRRLTGPGRKAAVAAGVACGRDILEVGAGTGMALQEYPPHCRVIATDLSEHMLRQARRKVLAGPLRHVTGVLVMDGCRLGFRDESFDAVSAQMMITLVPDPEGALDEFARVLRPGGEIILVNHFGADSGPRARLEEAVAPLVSRIGWSSAFRVSRLAAWAKRRGDFTIAEVRPLKPFGFFTLVRLRKAGADRN
ncbi:class I SAM-dependent methyltransferase [Camelimonas abortus]|uniref:Class I SAM-dependent methyltransferase n=1 Tax=Camelimonas abortus TaxID=1017184 RepID=A0ABV7LEL2_9HYPH